MIFSDVHTLDLAGEPLHSASEATRLLPACRRGLCPLSWCCVRGYPATLSSSLHAAVLISSSSSRSAFFSLAFLVHVLPCESTPIGYQEWTEHARARTHTHNHMAGVLHVRAVPCRPDGTLIADSDDGPYDEVLPHCNKLTFVH